ncbi:SGNH/GDSL hydrolase family protein [Lysinibacillus sp. LZ02]|uniref:SGNH/GDSL hydrolase family protein n=1 Tax=Lysinibacillus sp. LZ02 TaxID=3420668 RepID=UPI003D367698
MKKLVICLLASFLFTSSASAKEIYVALGDSLAAGQTPYSEIDAGYTDFIAMQLMRAGQLQSFTKQLAFPGYSVGDVLERVQTEEADTLLRDATIITISAGANNLLPLMAHNPQNGTMSFSQLSVNFALNKAREDYIELLKHVNEVAPNADVYVMGYYFPYVSVHAEQAVGVKQQLHLLNEILATVASAYGAQFVDVAFSGETSRYLPNVADVHPNMEGYRVMANALLEKLGVMPMSTTQLPEPNPLTFQEILQMQQQQQTNEEQVAVKPIEQYVVYYGYDRFKRLFL